MEWVHSENRHQEYWECPTSDRFLIGRNLMERHWTIYERRGRGLRMIPNPFKAEHETRFQEITRLPSHGKNIGDHPADDAIGRPSPNYAWDSAAQCKMAVEVIEAYRKA
jgi:hypothetical protein